MRRGGRRLCIWKGDINMNILFFLTPKSDVTYVTMSEPIDTAVKAFTQKHFTVVPVIDDWTGKYVGTLSAQDLLSEMQRHPHLTSESAGERIVSSMQRYRDYLPVKADADIEDLLTSATTQNFVPVVDDTGAFIGIITRREIMYYLVSVLDDQKKRHPSERVGEMSVKLKIS